MQRQQLSCYSLVEEVEGIRFPHLWQDGLISIFAEISPNQQVIGIAVVDDVDETASTITNPFKDPIEPDLEEDQIACKSYPIRALKAVQA